MIITGVSAHQPRSDTIAVMGKNKELIFEFKILLIPDR